MGTYVWPSSGPQSDGTECSRRLAGQDYSSARYSESMKVKHLLLLCSQHVCEHEAWEVIPPSVLREACNQGRKDLDRQVHRDIQNVWVRPLTPGEALSKFKLSKSMLAKAAALRSRGARASEARSMPSTLGDKVLSAFMRNGQALCGAFRLDAAPKPNSNAGGSTNVLWC